MYLEGVSKLCMLQTRVLGVDLTWDVTSGCMETLWIGPRYVHLVGDPLQSFLNCICQRVEVYSSKNAPYHRFLVD